jgi:Spy/CpxP family protein refolding chaperone
MKDGIESLGRVRLQGLALLLLAFVVGVVGGMAAERIRATHFAGAPPLPMGLGAGRDALPPGLNRLDLTADQQERIRAILAARQPITDSLVRTTMPRLAAIHDSVRAEIRAVLTPEQRQRFDQFERRGMRRGGAAGRGGPREGGPPRPF